MLGTRTLWRTSYGRPQRASVRTFFPEAKPKVSTPSPGPAAVSEVVEAGAPKVEKKARIHRRVLDHWKNFWLGIKTDYTEAVLDFKKDAQAKPVKSAILGAFAGFLLYCNQHNRVFLNNLCLYLLWQWPGIYTLLVVVHQYQWHPIYCSQDQSSGRHLVYLLTNIYYHFTTLNLIRNHKH